MEQKNKAKQKQNKNRTKTKTRITTIEKKQTNQKTTTNFKSSKSM